MTFLRSLSKHAQKYPSCCSVLRFPMVNERKYVSKSLFHIFTVLGLELWWSAFGLALLSMIGLENRSSSSVSESSYLFLEAFFLEAFFFFFFFFFFFLSSSSESLELLLLLLLLLGSSSGGNFAASFLAFSRFFLSSLSGQMLAVAPGEIRSFGLVMLSGILMESSSLFGSSWLELVTPSVEGVLNCDICSARCLSARRCFASLFASFWPVSYTHLTLPTKA